MNHAPSELAQDTIVSQPKVGSEHLGDPRSWSCEVCAADYWKAPDPRLLDDACTHHADLRRLLGGQAAADAAQQAGPPPTTAEPSALKLDILNEIETMGVRLVELARMLREDQTDGAELGDLAPHSALVDGA